MVGETETPKCKVRITNSSNISSVTVDVSKAVALLASCLCAIPLTRLEVPGWIPVSGDAKPDVVSLE